MSRRLGNPALLIPALGLGFALLFSAQNLYRSEVLHLHVDLKNVAVESLTRWLLYAAFAPLVGALVARFPIERGHGARRWALYAASGVLFAGFHSVGMGLVYAALKVYPPQDTVFEAIMRLSLVFFGVNFVVFWATAGVYHALRYHREALAREQLASTLTGLLSEARLENLRAQLNPHFLFNTLNAVSALALTGEREQVVRTLSQLSDILRVSLDPNLPQEIPLARELELLEGYLEIQRVRFGERLALVPDIAPAALDALVPTMLLQPLVENALQHGIEARPGPGRVVVLARREADMLCLRVEDTGPGFQAGAAGSARAGIGLSNTRARLEQLYAGAQSLVCGNLAGEGAFVEVRLPFRPAAARGSAA